MLKTFEYRIYPTKGQARKLDTQLNDCRWLYNHFLGERKAAWENDKKSLNYHAQALSLPNLKDERPSLALVHSQVLQNVAVRIDLAMKAFFRRVKAGETPGYPRFKSYGRYDSMTFPQVGSAAARLKTASWITDIEGKFVFISQTYKRTYNVVSEQVLGKNILNIYPREIAEEYITNIRQAYDTGQALQVVEPFPRSDGTTGHALVYKFPLPDLTGQQLVGGVSIDISDRVEVEKALRQSKEMYRLLVRNLPDSSVLIFDRDMRFLIAEGGLLEKSGFSREMLEGRTLQEVLQPEDTARLLPYYQAALAGIENNFEEYYDDRVYMVRAVPILDEQRRIVAGMVFSENITELKQAQQILAEEKEQLSVTLRSIGDGVITTDLSGKVVMLNRVAEELTGWVQNEAIGLPITNMLELIDQTTRQSQVNPVEEVIKSGQTILLSDHVMLITRDGTERLISDSCAPILDQQSRIIGAVLVFRDITEQKRADEELQKTSQLEALGVLAGGIAHDFNNLLAGILGFLDLIDLSLNNEKAIEVAQVIDFIGEARKAAIRAKDLTFQLLTFARGGNPIRKLASLNQIIREATNFALHGRNVGVVFNLPERLWTVEVDSGQLGQVIQNLVINAAQAMPEGGFLTFSGGNLSLVKETITQLAPGKYVKVSLHDTGLGIPPETLAKIFDPYYTTKLGGSGLGLAVCYSIIKKHEGYITVESELGKGTTFHVYLPVSGNPEELDKPPVAPQRVLYSQDNKYRVLVMDDEPSLRDVLKRTLNRLGSEVEVAKNGGEAIQLYEAALKTGQPFDIVFLDLTVPGGMGGKQTLVRLRELDPQVKAVVCSGYSSDPILSNYQEYGFWDVLTKPFRIEDLVKVLRRVSQEYNEVPLSLG